MQQQGILKAEAISPLFFRVCTEICIESYVKAKAAPGLPPAMSFQAVDAFARLIVLLVRYHVDPSGTDHNHARLNLTAKILSIIVLVLVHSHEQQRTQFNQRPFFRLFSTLLNDLNMFERDLQPIYIQILSAVRYGGDVFRLICVELFAYYSLLLAIPSILCSHLSCRASPSHGSSWFLTGTLCPNCC